MRNMTNFTTSRVVFNTQRAIIGNLTCNNAEIQKTILHKLKVDECSVQKFTNLPILPFTATQSQHIVNKEFVDDLVKLFITSIDLGEYNNLTVNLEPQSNLNDIFVICDSRISPPPLHDLTISLDVGVEICKLKIINTSASILNIRAENSGEKMYNFFFNPSGNQPMPLRTHIQAEFFKTNGNWYVSTS
jgi:hypothetical protein